MVASFVAVVPVANCSAVAVADLAVVIVVSTRLVGVVVDRVAAVVVAPRFGDVIAGLVAGVVVAPHFGDVIADRVGRIAGASRFAVAARGPAGALSKLCPRLEFGTSLDFLPGGGGLVRNSFPCTGCSHSAGFHPRD